MTYEVFYLTKRLELFCYCIENEKVGANFVVTEKGIIFASVNDIQRGHKDVTRRQIIAIN